METIQAGLGGSGGRFPGYGQLAACGHLTPPLCHFGHSPAEIWDARHPRGGQEALGTFQDSLHLIGAAATGDHAPGPSRPLELPG